MDGLGGLEVGLRADETQAVGGEGLVRCLLVLACLLRG